MSEHVGLEKWWLRFSKHLGKGARGTQNASSAAIYPVFTPTSVCTWRKVGDPQTGRGGLNVKSVTGLAETSTQPASSNPPVALCIETTRNLIPVTPFYDVSLELDHCPAVDIVVKIST